jgi:hypothetical protein
MRLDEWAFAVAAILVVAGVLVVVTSKVLGLLVG